MMHTLDWLLAVQESKIAVCFVQLGQDFLDSKAL